jgi:hypothetical protein
VALAGESAARDCRISDPLGSARRARQTSLMRLLPGWNREAGPVPAPAVKRNPTVGRPGPSRYATNSRKPEHIRPSRRRSRPPNIYVALVDGALCWRHASAGLTVFVFPFVLPYYRATVYSGDRIAHACCGDLEVSLHAVYRALVGKEVAPHLRADGLVGQALTARRRRLLRFAQLWRATPHATNRYLDLLAFVRQRTPDAFQTHRAQLGTAGEKAEPVLARLAGRRPHQNAPVVGIVLAAVALLGGVITGVAFHNSPMAQALADTYRAATSQDSNGGGSDTTVQPSPTESPSASTTETTPSQDTAELLALVPAGIQSSCTPDASNATGTLSGLTCHPGGDGPASLSLYAYTDSAAMISAFKDYVGDLPTGSCSTGEDRQGTWTYSNITQGPIACYVSRAGDATILWGSNDKAVLALAQDTSWTLTQMYTWWINDAPNLQ